MTEHETTPLFRKRGRRYVPAYSEVGFDRYDRDMMAVGSFRLTHAYNDGGRRYEYDVTSDTAALVAALVLYQVELERIILEAAVAVPMRDQNTRQFTPKQQAVLVRYQAEMLEAGGSLPTWWSVGSAHGIARAARDAVAAKLAKKKS